MKRSIVLLLALTVALTLAAVPVSAGPPTAASGTWDYWVTAPPVFEPAGPNVFIYGQATGEWHGTFEGFTEEEFVVACHPKAGFSFFKGEMTFEGTVDGAEGTMVMKANGKQVSDTCEPSDALWHGRWVIIGGTGDLADVHGQGTLEGPSFHLTYEGQIHFD